ncbi:MAG: efflux RND transporter periplasmic adaptor subunit [Syntrophomonadaceae bacterium]
MQSYYKNKILYWGIFFVLVAVGSYCLLRVFNSSQTVNEEPLQVRSMVVQMDSGDQEFKYPGEVHGRYESLLAFRVNGKILTRNVDVGSTVKPGDILMQVDSSDSQLSVQIGEATLASVESKMKLAQDNMDRSKALYEAEALSKAQYDAAVDTDKAAESAYHQAQAQLQQLSNQLQYCSLQADSAGTIATINVETGQFVAAGTPVIKLVQDGEREVEVNVPENRIDALGKATGIKVTFWSLPGTVVEGRVREVSPVANPVARTFRVRIGLIDPPADLKIGMTSSVKLIISRLEPVSFATIPLSAIYQTGDSPAVWVIENETVQLRNIEIAAFTQDQVKVSKGLNDGERIVTAGVNKLLAGQKVKLFESSQ